MKNTALTLMSIAASALQVRYNPYISRKLLVEYIKSTYLSFKSGNLLNSSNAQNK